MNNSPCGIAFLIAIFSFAVVALPYQGEMDENKRITNNIAYMFFRTIPLSMMFKEIEFKIFEANNLFQDMKMNENLRNDKKMQSLLDYFKGNNFEDISQLKRFDLKILKNAEYLIWKKYIDKILIQLTKNDADLAYYFIMFEFVSILDNNLLKLDHCSTEIQKNASHYANALYAIDRFSRNLNYTFFIENGHLEVSKMV
ncbi:uncharacterized protein LOC122504032 isoform X2 [Leptopilina heterotoma]|uniref:uncharacterized protein LOC122504032 isoform X2 n=1 Tax=Leptopilina heterotoma TaxID=63436 RepID=UPI001CA8A24F|nr:uncharacterized protein LOC122504032 isoform X2 [Leptopilina heterotoma]